MRNLKKFLALVLAMMMAFSLVVTASAAKWNSAAGDFADQSGVTAAFEEGVAVVTGMKIFKGDAGTNDFSPARSIKRSEVAAIVYRLVTGDVNDSSAYLYTNVAPFTDVNPTDWFAGYVGYLWNAEIIKGSNTERTQFNPYGEVTGYEALAMVLRAMGYDANDEYTGAGWQIRVGQTARERDLLVNVDSTNYGAGHLNAAARRDTVAEIIFQAATKATVVYTPAFGYQTGNLTNGLNGNVDTRSLGYANFGLTYDRGIVVGNQATGESVTKLGVATRLYEDGLYNTREITGDSYDYDGISTSSSHNTTKSDATVPTIGSTVYNFDHETPLDQFGHANKVWYNVNKDSKGVNHSYAWFDEATKTATVYVGVGTHDPSTNVNSEVYDKAKAAGFSITGIEDSLFGSNRYDRMGPILNTVAAGTVSDDEFTTRDEAVESDRIFMYSLISNSANNKLDVVIALDAEVALIYDTNTTNTAERIVLRNALNGGEALGRAGKEILTSHLTTDSVRTLGVDVTSWVVDGTVKTDAERNLDSFYRTVAVQTGPTGTVLTVDSNGTVTLSNGTKIEKSRLYDVVREGTNFTQPERISAGVNFTFVLDQFGHYLGVTSDPGYSFIYATFADHSYGNVGSGQLSYLVYGVDANGGKITDHTLTQKWNYTDNGFKGMNGYEFNQIQTARRDYGNTEEGNQVAKGVYRAGVITADGKWIANDEDNTTGWSNILDKTGTANSWNDEEDWVITSTDATRGFKDVSTEKDGSLLVTNNTVFYVVSGTGTATLNVKTYNGMTAFLDNATQAIIESQYKDAEGDAWSYDVAYMTNYDTYHSVGDRDNQNAMVTKVFVYENAVKRNSTTTMFYVHDDSATGLKIAKNATEYYEYEQYELWQGATKANYFLSGNITPEADTFYTMQKNTTVNGIDVYDLVEVDDKVYTAGGSCWENVDIDYFATNDTSTARIGEPGVNATVYGVKNAVVVDLTKLSNMHSDGGCGNDHDAHNEIKSVADLFYAISVGYDVDVSIVNTNSDVSLIYVVHVDNAPIYNS